MDKISAVKAPIEVVRSVLFFVLMSFVASSFASVITPINDEVLFTASTDHIDDILVTAIKNSENNISFNELADFNVTKPLTIYNGVRTSDATDYSDAADTIFISANLVALSSHIKIIGAPADLVIISLSNTPITCTNCSFSNAGRVTLAHGTYSDSDNIGNIIAKPSGSISINGLAAPGVLSLEVIAETINISGTIDTNLRADTHPEGGLVINEQGAKVVGSGGVNIYSGKTTIAYQNLKIESAINAGSLNLSGNINSASINITSPNSINIPQASKLNTLSDVLSSSTRNGQFYAPLEGIFLTTIKNIGASINISGSLATDNSISLKSHNNINLNSSSKTIANKLELLATGVITTNGIMQVSSYDVAANEYRNTGNIQAKTVLVQAVNNIFNSYGGKIQAKNLTFSTPNGSVVNGSRDTKISYEHSMSLPLSVDLTTSLWGIKNLVNATGATSNNLSAHILANEIYIKSKTLENINPYHIDRPTDTAWDEGIAVNNVYSNRVSIQAENMLKIVATESVLNSSALIGLNQEGSFHVNTPKFSNERYHLSVETFKYTQLTLSDNESRKHDVIKTGDATKVTSYSPPGRMYSFGDFKFNHVNPAAQSEFINEFSYFEAFKDLYFYKADVKTLGLETGIRFQGASLQTIRSCIIFQHCLNEATTTSAESETLFSVRGNVYGIDPSIPSQSDLTIDNINTLEVETQHAIEAFLAQFHIGNRSTDIYSYIRQSSVNGDILTATLIECEKKAIIADGGHYEHVCNSRELTQNISTLIDDITANNDYENTGYTYQQLKNAIEKYVEGLPPVFKTHGYFKLTSREVSLKGFDYDSSNDKMTVLYKEVTHYLAEVDDGQFEPRTNTFHLNKVMPLSTLIPFIAQP